MRGRMRDEGRTHFFLLRRSLSAGPSVPVLLRGRGSPEAGSSEGVEASSTEQTGERPLLTPRPSSPGVPVEAESRPSWPRRAFSFFPNRRPMEDLMLFFLLDLCSESWLLLAELQSADRLEAESGGAGLMLRPSQEGSSHNALEATLARPVSSCVGLAGVWGGVSDLRNSRGSSNMAPGWVRVILSNRSARAEAEGAESSSARARSSSLLFCRVEKSSR